MASARLTSLTTLTTPAAADVLYIVDASDTTDSALGTSKQIAFSDLTSTFPTIPVPISSGGTASITASAARTALGLAIGTNVQAWDADLDTWATKTAPSGAVVGTSDSQALTGKTISGLTVTTTAGTLTIANNASASLVTSGNFAITLTATGTTGVTLPTSGTLATLAGTETLSNKRITRRVVSTTQSATPAINTDVTDISYITGLAQAITSMTSSLTGTPANGDSLIISITDNGTARGITWGASFESSGNITLPTTTVLSVRLDVGFLWNVATSKWRCCAIA